MASVMPTPFYEHKMIAAEMLFALLEAWDSLDQIRSEDGAGPHNMDYPPSRWP